MLKEINKTADAYETLPLNEEQLHAKRLSMFLELKKFMKSHLLPKFGRASIIKFIIKATQKPFKICELRGLVKLHKPGDKMRILFPLAGHPLSNLHKFIAKCLEPAVIKHPSVITNVVEIIDWLANNVVPAGSTFCTADIGSMYPNIDRTAALAIATQELKKISTNFTKYDPTIFWKRILKDAHTNIEFRFQDKLFNQIKGVPIGSPAGPQIAMIYLHTKIKQQWRILQEDILFGGIYFDDAFIIFKPGIQRAEIHEKLSALLQNTSLKFEDDSYVIKTVEELQYTSFDILDISIQSESQEANFKCYTKMYSKPIGGSQYLHYCSAHPPAIKRSIIKGELSRRLRLTEKIEDWIATRQDLWLKLRRRKYPISVLATEFRKVRFEDQKTSRDQLIKKIKERRENLSFPITDKIVQPPTETTVPIITRYEPTILRNAKRRRQILENDLNEIFSQNRLRIKRVRLINAFKVSNKLQSIFNKKSSAASTSTTQTDGSSSSSSTLELVPSERVEEN